MPSEPDDSGQARHDLPDAAIRAQLERILASEVFSRSQQLRRFLSFIVERRLAGQGHSIKESVLAHELYGKGTGFDGGTDPVVRVDARRLRDKLREYYEGRSDPVLISLPKGSYVPVFEATSSFTETAPTGVFPGLPERRRVTSLRRTMAVGALALVPAAIVAVLSSDRLRRPAEPPVRLLPLASYPGVEGPPALSPDGNLVAFAWSGHAESGPTDIYVKAVEAEALRQLTATPESESSPAWSPDGHSIAFVRDGHGVFTMSQLGGAERQVSASGTHVAWAGDSKSVLIRDREGNSGPMDLGASLANDTIESQPFSNSSRIEGSARFSADGSRIAVSSFRSGAQEMWVAGRDGGALQQVTTLGAVGLWVGGWSPDGSQIAFEAAIGGNTDVYVVGRDGGHLRRLTVEPSIDGVPTWSGDGRWIYFASTRAGVLPDIWRVSPGGGEASRVTRNGGFEPRESPDGRHLFYLDRGPGGQTIPARLMRVPLAGGPEELVLEGIRPFLWSVTDTGIVFVTREPDFDAIDVYRFSDQQVARVGRLGFRLPGIYTHLTVSRDGRWALATKMVRFDADLMRLDNFR